MPVFTYRAINDDSKEVRGQIDAVDLDAAKTSLEDTHLDVVEIHEASRQSATAQTVQEGTPPALKTSFAFEGKDSTGTVRRGTIQSETKYQAFEKLKHDQKLFVLMLSPLGVTPQYRDNDLENWQKKDMPSAAPQKTAATTIAAAPAAKPIVPAVQPNPVAPAPKIKSIGFTAPTPSPTTSPALAVQARAAPLPAGTKHDYHPLVATLRLYAGWLLAWYGLFVALGYYTHVRALPWSIPFVEAFFISPLIFSFIVAIFLFLMLGSIHRLLHGRWISRIVSLSVGIGAFVGVRMSIV